MAREHDHGAPERDAGLDHVTRHVAPPHLTGAPLERGELVRGEIREALLLDAAGGGREPAPRPGTAELGDEGRHAVTVVGSYHLRAVAGEVTVVICSRDRPEQLASALEAIRAALRPGDDAVVI